MREKIQKPTERGWTRNNPNTWQIVVTLLLYFLCLGSDHARNQTERTPRRACKENMYPISCHIIQECSASPVPLICVLAGDAKTGDEEGPAATGSKGSKDVAARGLLRLFGMGRGSRRDAAGVGDDSGNMS